MAKKVSATRNEMVDYKEFTRNQGGDGPVTLRAAFYTKPRFSVGFLQPIIFEVSMYFDVRIR